MSFFKVPALVLAIFSLLFSAQWGNAPVGWGDFQMGLNARPGANSAIEMQAALAAGAKLDRRYVYATTPQEVFPDGSAAFLFTSWRNYAKENGFWNKGVRPTITIYMIQQGADGLEAVKSGAANQTFMKEYFDAILVMLDSCKGTQPIFVLEPDIWGYMLQNYEADMGEANLNSVCHLNDLGFSWLSEFNNTLRDLPKAIIKTIKLHDPEAYAGILMAYWSYRPTSASGSIMVQFSEADVITSGQKAGEFAQKLVGDGEWRGDFIGVEKNGAAAGWYVTQGRSEYMWNDTENAKWLLWSKEMAQKVNLPLVGWQISAGYDNEAGYPALPNTSQQFKDTFFPYFFNNTAAFIDAGFIGMMLGAEDRGVGTVCSIDPAKFDHGYFYDNLEVFNAARPYDLDLIPTPVHNEAKTVVASPKIRMANGALCAEGFEAGTMLEVFDMRGVMVKRVKLTKGTAVVAGHDLSNGSYIIKSNGVTAPLFSTKITIVR